MAPQYRQYRELVGYFNNSIGDKQPFTSPGAGIFGPKVMIVNETAGSGGDYLPYSFQKKKIGPLVGTKTWGGLVGWGGAPPLVDGGYMGAPRWGFFNTDGEWDVENIGVTPDVIVEQEPRLVITGKDPQLEKAIEIAMEMLKTDGVELKPQPADPVRVLYKRGR
ncbi:MAG: S41 family peptidase [Bacteroidales bacterium]